ncbi:MAG TPA: NAD-dependent epimerase/dehydratase family protein [Intrasporangium sp.]|uniref:NAD-dependent epimerase/dehydratase family protein n=1 Tax=Intrasporangium sp. TaxID=1925024 RepID=UPI002D7A247E|nr:NAD-dependent epimerase/dehydratase family protein [Intrasporangium sp.]HET7398045.1 NAD-dependent epimerase/dehydratase family protein [Intrasporangium sp.]
MKIVVTGASGNVGTALLGVLRGRGHEVGAVVRRPPPPVAPYDVARWTALDLSQPASEPRLRELLSEADALVHLAWGFHPMRRPDYLRAVSVGVLERVVRVALDVGVAHVAHTSSVAVYSPRTTPSLVDETWPPGGIPTATYSQHKVAAEATLRRLAAAAGAEDRVAVLRPALVGHYAAGGPMLRCGLPGIVPGAVLRHVPVLPVDPRFGIQLVHARDLADALVRVVERRAHGPFNIAAEPLLRGPDIAAALGARPVPLRREHARALLAAAWHAHLHPLDPGWVDMALEAPWVDSSRAREELGWHPRHTALDVLAELVRGMSDGSGTASPALRPRRVLDACVRAAREGTVARRALT